MQHKGCDVLLPGVSQRIGQAFAASFPSFTPTLPLECTLPLHTHTLTHVLAHTSLFLWKNTSFYLQKPRRLTLTGPHPVLCLFTLLFHNAGINFSKPIWAVARSGKERSAELLCWGKFPLHTSLEVDCFPLYAARFNLHTEQREWGIEGGQEGEKALNTQLGITNVFTEVSSALPCASFSLFASSATSLACLTSLDSLFNLCFSTGQVSLVIRLLIIIIKHIRMSHLGKKLDVVILRAGCVVILYE